MRNAWNLIKEHGYTKSRALKLAWLVAKTTKKEVNNTETLEVAVTVETAPTVRRSARLNADGTVKKNFRNNNRRSNRSRRTA